MAGRRGNGEGSISKRDDGRWMARISAEGMRRSFYGKTRQEVTEKLLQARQDVRQGLPLLTDRQTVGQYLETWHLTMKARLATSSHRRYGNYIRLHIIPEIGHIPLAKLTAQQLQLLYARRMQAGLSGNSVERLHAMLKSALKEALLLNLIQRNVADLVKPPRLQHYEMRPLNPTQVRQLVEAIKGDRFEAFYILALTTGMRRGELLALRWQDIDMARRCLSVRQGLREDHNRWVIRETKTKYSRRTIGLTDGAITALHRHWDRQQKERLWSGFHYDEALDLVFTNTVGKIQDPNDITKLWFKRLLKQANLPNIRFHDIRHTCATLLLAAGVSVKVVSEMLGHSDIAITLRVYAHVMPHMQQAAVSAMENLLASPELRKVEGNLTQLVS